MNPQSANQNPQTTIELTIRTMRIVWIGMVASIGVYYVFTIFRGRPENVDPNPTVSLALLIGAAMAAGVSFLIKSKLLAQAVVQVLASWDWAERPTAVVSLGSLSRPRLVDGLAERIAKLGRMGYLGSLGRTTDTGGSPS